MKKITLLLFLIISLFLNSCDLFNSSDSENLEDKLFNGVAFSETDNPLIPAVAVHDSGEWMGIINEGNSSEPTGAVYGDGKGNNFVVHVGNDGLPERAYSNGYIFLFENFRSNLVDIAIINPDGEIEIEREVEINGLESQSFEDDLNFKRAGGGSISAWRFAAITLAATGCAIAVIGTGGAASVPLAVPCGAAVVSVGVALVESNNELVNASADGIGIGAAAIGCAASEPFSCAALVAEIGATVHDSFERAQDENREEIAVASGALATGSGDVQITLTWDEAVDLDLWVTDPENERIWFANRESGSGGQLDQDDVDGFGPENIFWPAGEAPSGEYKVEVDHYLGNKSTTYTVLIQAFGNVKSIEGIISPGETIEVTRFTDDGVSKTINLIVRKDIENHQTSEVK